MKKCILFFTSLVMVCVLSTFSLIPALAIVSKSDEFYVNDSAGVLSSSTENEIISVNGDLEHYCKGAQIVVVTVDYSDGLYSDEYANKLFYDWGVGDANENNGMLLLLIIKENKGWLATGDGIDSKFNDTVANNYLNEYFWDDFDKGNYDRAVTTLLGKLTDWYKDYYDVSFSSGGQNVTDSSDSPASGWSSLLIMLIVFALILFLVFRASDKNRYNSYYTYMGITPPRPYHFWYMWGNSPHRIRKAPYNTKPNIPNNNNRPSGSSSSNHYSGSGFGGGGRSGGGGGGRSGRSSSSSYRSSSSSRSSSFGSRSGGSFVGRSGGGFGGGGRSGGGGGGRR